MLKFDVYVTETVVSKYKVFVDVKGVDTKPGVTVEEWARREARRTAEAWHNAGETPADLQVTERVVEAELAGDVVAGAVIPPVK